MVYSEDCDGTLLAYCDLLKSFHVSWTENGTMAEATHKKTLRISLSFKLDSKAGEARGTGLMADVTAIWHLLVGSAEEQQIQVAAVGCMPRMNKRELMLAREVNRFPYVCSPK